MIRTMSKYNTKYNNLLFNLRKLKEMVLHHACCITCATIAVYTGTYSGYAMVGLSMEVNSIFLHAR